MKKGVWFTLKCILALPLCVAFVVRWTCACSKDRKRCDTSGKKEALNSKHHEALKEHQGSLRPFMAAFLPGTQLLLVPLFLLFLLSPSCFATQSDQREPFEAARLVLTRTQGSGNRVSAAPNSRPTLAGGTWRDELRTLQGHVGIFQTGSVPVLETRILSFLWFVDQVNCLSL